MCHSICSVLNSRFLLALYETSASLERGGASDLSFSLNLSEGSPELPEYLTSLAGPVHLVPDDDDNVELSGSELTPGIGPEASAEVEGRVAEELTREVGQQV